MQTESEHHPEKSPSPSVDLPPAPPRPAQRINLDRLFLYRRGELQWDQMTGFRGGARRQGHQLMLWSFMAILIDCLVLLSMSCVFLVAFATIVQSPFGEILRVFLKSSPYVLFAGVFLVCSWLYLTVMRVFLGFSLGEWACDLRLGQPTQRARASYPLRVVVRSSVIVLTGLLTLPILSLILGRDLAGRFSGIHLMSLK